MNRRLNMATTTTKKTIETANDKKNKTSAIEIIRDIDIRLTHLEDLQLDNRDLIVKLVKQGNTVVEFLKDFQIEPIDAADLEMGMSLPPLSSNEERMGRTAAIKDIIDDILALIEHLQLM